MRPIILLLVLVSSSSWAIIRIGVEPIVGYERVQKLVPNAHTVDRLVYGTRVTAGVLFLAGEAEYLRGEDTEIFTGLTVKDTSDKAKLGVRGMVRLLLPLYLYARAGGQATRNRHQETVDGVTTVSEGPVKYHPYGGAGLRLVLGRNLSLTGDMTVVFVNFPSMAKNEYQTTAGLSIQFP